MAAYNQNGDKRTFNGDSSPPPQTRFYSDGSITWEEFYALLRADIIKNRAELAQSRVPKARRETLQQRIGSATKTIVKYGGEVP